MRKKQWVAVCLLNGLAAATMVGGIAGGTAQAATPAITPEALTDYQQIAAELNIPVAQAVNDASWQNAFARMSTNIAAGHPQEFTEGAIVDAAAHVGRITFKGAVPSDVPGVVAAASGFTVQLVGNAGLSQLDIDAAVDSVHTQVQRLKSDLADYSTSYDRSLNTFEVSATNSVPAWAGVAAVQAGAASISALSPQVTSPIPGATVKITSTTEPVAEDQAVYGGGFISLNNSLTCTGAFTATTASGLTGIVTAGHCYDSGVKYMNFWGDYAQGMTFKIEHRGNYGDMQFHTVSTTETNYFYDDTDHVRKVTAVANPSKGQYICRFGRKTGKHCGSKVSNLSTCVTHDGYKNCHLVQMDTSASSQGGDSGGPWFIDGTAYGIHKGTKQTLLGGVDAIWSRVTYLEEALGVTVMR